MKTLSLVPSNWYNSNSYAPILNLKGLFSTMMLMLFVIGMNAQVPVLSQKYQLRERIAPTSVKNQLRSMRQTINTKKLKFNVGYTEVSTTPLSQLAGEIELSATEKRNLKAMLRAKPFMPNFGITTGFCTAGLTKFDSRNKGYITPVRRQQCGNCWAYAAMAMFEANYVKVNGVNPANVNTSEQYVVSCSGGGSCSGGLSYKVFRWMVDNNANVQTENNMPDAGVNGNCPGAKPNTSYYAEDWGICRPDGDISKIASVSKIKEAICKYGAVKTSLTATALMQNYSNGVFNEFPSNYASPSSNHAVLIVGWDDTKNAWLIKNSWGTNWGMNGYMWIDYGSNNVGRRACWVKAKKIKFQINPGLVANTPGIKANIPNTTIPSFNPSFTVAKKSWKNTDSKTRGITKVAFSNNGKTIQAWGSCHPKDCDWGKTSVKPYRGGKYESKAVFNSRVGTKILYIDKNGNRMNIKLISQYRDGRKSKTNFYSFVYK